MFRKSLKRTSSYESFFFHKNVKYLFHICPHAFTYTQEKIMIKKSKREEASVFLFFVFFSYWCMMEERLEALISVGRVSPCETAPLMATKAPVHFWWAMPNTEMCLILFKCVLWLKCVDVFFWTIANSNSPQWKSSFLEEAGICDFDVNLKWEAYVIRCSAQRGASDIGREACPWNSVSTFGNYTEPQHGIGPHNQERCH